MRDWLALKLGTAFFNIISFFSPATGPQIPKFSESDRVQARAQMLDAIQEVKADPFTLKLVGLEGASSEAKHFLHLYQTEYWPYRAEMQRLSSLYALYYVLVDRNLADPRTEETREFKQKLLDYKNQLDQASADPKWKDILQRTAAAAQGLSGRIPEMVRDDYSLDKLVGLKEADLPISEKINELEKQAKDISNNSPVAKKLAGYLQKTTDIERRFYQGQLSLQDAGAAYEKLLKQSYLAHSVAIATTGKDVFNSMAILRSQLAQQKGFSNWADYVLIGKHRLYKPGYENAAGRILFLRNALADTRSLVEKYYRAELAKHDMTLENATPAQLGLMSPETSTLLRDYFPLERNDELWKQTMLESGFQESDFRNIVFDSYPRPKKHTHAYMFNTTNKRPLVTVLDASVMEYQLPEAEDLEAWAKAYIYIVQNNRDDGPNETGTNFHEGGHAIDYTHRLNPDGVEQDSAYSETHSMTMERFLVDADYIVEHARSRDGRSVPYALAQAYVVNEKLRELLGLRRQLFNALYDILIWNEPYHAEGETFLERSSRIYKELHKQYMFGSIEPKQGLDPSLSQFSTGHFWGGEVRYIGYNFAQIAAWMSEEALLSKAEAVSGRRTLSRQSFIANDLIQRFYQNGFKKPFPQGVEDFTGREFSSQIVVEKLNTALQKFCAVLF